MSDELYSVLPFVAGGSVLVALLLVLFFLRIRKSGRKKVDQQRQQVRALEKELQKTNKQLLEVRSVMVGLGQKVAEQQDIIQHLNERITEIEHTDNDGRLYTRASKMVQLGAGINELIEECELPKAEAELMMSLQNKIAGKEKVPPLSGRTAPRRRQDQRRPQKNVK
ncbi:DUF2802 domain-containing protein [Vibrio sp. vnigr-6D03]|uniref:DUF2802 domain-containing protein n=1 Tax=Vibrio TaxID=662 RepID=UPI000C3202B3|nr:MULTISPECIES: DUF2802 domain-containing protein [Vibrio]PKF79055.1 DUF2802 domain-containing protein [Vibrio sp. vnigr-6D03]RTZ21538.1 DUF2802 domain-containing protein [Vibrio penaeicida]